MNMEMMILAGGGVMALLLVLIALSGPSASKAVTRRLATIKLHYSESAETRLEQQMRRAIASRRPVRSLSNGEGTMAEKMAARLSQTGKRWTIQKYLYISGGIAGTVALTLLIIGAPPVLALVAGIALGLWLPHMYVGMAIKRRLNRFNTYFPDAIDLLVRGLRSGLPVGETLGVVAAEIPGPVGEEFKLVTERIKIGRSMEDALQETADRLGTPEFQFFCITLAIQRETGGNLAETLANLGDVLRKRAQMKLKIKAMSSESKASAYIVGSLPFIVITLISIVNWEYISKFLVDERLMIAGIGGFTWMGIGVWIMAKMVSFEI